MFPLRKYSHLLTLVFFTIFPLRIEAEANSLNQHSKTVLTNCNIISCSGSKLMKNMTLTIIGNKISEIKRGKYKPARGDKDINVIDLEGG